MNNRPEMTEAARAYRNAYQREINRRNRQRYQTQYWIRKAEKLQEDLIAQGHTDLADQLQTVTGEELNRLTEQALHLLKQQEGSQA